MNYVHAIKYLNQFINFERLPDPRFDTREEDLERFQALLSSLGSPQEQFPIVHIVGTKGKGSTAAILASILRASGYRVGVYTSPHLVTVRERINVDGSMISKRGFASVIADIGRRPFSASLKESLSFRTVFEILTAAAMIYFARNKVDIAIVEAGLGARLDATIVLRPILVLITPIGLDHTSVLGETVSLIAADKAHAIRPGGMAISAPQSPEAERELILRAEAVGATLEFAAGPKEFNIISQKPSATRFETRSNCALPPGMHIIGVAGSFQLGNLSLALAAAEKIKPAGFLLTGEAISRGIRRVRWAGRLQSLPRRPRLVLDGAHNPFAMGALRDALSELFPRPPVHAVVSALRGRPLGEMLKILSPAVEGFHLAPIRFSKGLNRAELEDAAIESGSAAKIYDSIPAALAGASGAAGEDGVVVATGSLYLVGEALRWHRRLPPPPPSGLIDDRY